MTYDVFRGTLNLAENSSRIVRWLDHLDAMCSRAWRALCAVG